MYLSSTLGNLTVTICQFLYRGPTRESLCKLAEIIITVCSIGPTCSHSIFFFFTLTSPSTTELAILSFLDNFLFLVFLSPAFVDLDGSLVIVGRPLRISST